MSIDKSSKLAPAISVRQLKAARALLAWSQADLAHHSGVSEPTIARLEAEDGELGGRPSTATKILGALLKAGIEFIPDQGDGTGVRLSSKAEIELSSAQCRGARAMLGWSQQTLASRSDLSKKVIEDFEHEARRPKPDQLSTIKRTLMNAGIEFFSDGSSAGGAATGIRLWRAASFSDQGLDYGRDEVINQEYSYQWIDITSVQCRMARIALGWGTRDLARAAGVSTDTVARMERGERLKSSTVNAFRSAFEAAGIEFIPENGGGPGVRAPKRKD